ncbi:hypothetical protein [Photobacterium leiognathi]|uniref:hypothetical protein n=1 Tax=Photobacterium leiognathi TaxID=553611 RepID=UPI0029822E9C|nr:hypothetical protein [Photobacterium leiognathi]
MARSVTRLTDREIKNASATGKEYILSDGNGLQLRVLKMAQRAGNLDITIQFQRKHKSYPSAFTLNYLWQMPVLKQ